MSVRTAWFLLVPLLSAMSYARADEPPDPVPEVEPEPQPFRTGEDVITLFSSQVTVRADGGVDVVEKLRVRVTGSGQVKHGLERDLPDRRPSFFLLQRRTPVGDFTATRDGQPEPVDRSEPELGVVRFRVGSGEVTVPPGEHEWTFSYSMPHIVEFEPTRDVLRWNVTGTGWEFPIETAEVFVSLPPGVQDVATEGWVGAEGSTESSVVVGGTAERWVVRSLRPLSYREGLSVGVSWAPGVLARPSAEERLRTLLEDSPEVVWMGGAVLLALLLQALVWLLVGRDPPAGPVRPSMTPPQGLSAAAGRYIERMAFDDTVFTAAITELAARGVLDISQDDDKTFVLEEREVEGASVPKVLQATANELFRTGGQVRVARGERARVLAARNVLMTQLKQAHHGPAFKTNRGLFWTAVVISAIAFAAAAVMSFGAFGIIVAFLTVWLSGWTVGVATLLRQVVAAWKAASVVGPVGYAGAIFISFFALPFLGGEIAAFVMMGVTTSWVSPLSFLLIGLVHYIAWGLVPRHTPDGRRAMDELENLRAYLLGRNGAPPPAQNDLLWPWAVALGVEKGWVERLGAASGSLSGGSVARPRWITGPVGAFTFHEFNRAFTANVSSISASSASGGRSGGGFSSGSGVGSGGGGGGGRGW